MDELLISVEEAAHRLSIGRTRTYALIASGELPSLKIGRSRRVALADLESWIEEQKKEQHSGESL